MCLESLGKRKRWDLLGFIGLGQQCCWNSWRWRAASCPHHVSQGLRGPARPCTVQNPLGRGGKAAAL